MPKWTEFYPERQGRPESKVAWDMETRLPAVSWSQLEAIIKQVLEDEMDERLKEMISALEELIRLQKLANLHLASGSDEDIEEDEPD